MKPQVVFFLYGPALYNKMTYINNNNNYFKCKEVAFFVIIVLLPFAL